MPGMRIYFGRLIRHAAGFRPAACQDHSKRGKPEQEQNRNVHLSVCSCHNISSISNPTEASTEVIADNVAIQPGCL
jgi:hypothetical protein